MNIELDNYFNETDIININKYITNLLQYPYDIKKSNYLNINKKHNILLCFYNCNKINYKIIININNIYDIKLCIYNILLRTNKIFHTNRSVFKFINKTSYCINYYNSNSLFIYKQIRKYEKFKFIENKNKYINYSYKKYINNFGIIFFMYNYKSYTYDLHIESKKIYYYNNYYIYIKNVNIITLYKLYINKLKIIIIFVFIYLKIDNYIINYILYIIY